MPNFNKIETNKMKNMCTKMSFRVVILLPIVIYHISFFKWLPCNTYFSYVLGTLIISIAFLLYSWIISNRKLNIFIFICEKRYSRRNVQVETMSNCWIAIGRMLWICIWVNLSYLLLLCTHMSFSLVTLWNSNNFDWTLLMKGLEKIINGIFWTPKIHLICIFTHRFRWIEIYFMHKRWHSKRFNVKWIQFLYIYIKQMGKKLEALFYSVLFKVEWNGLRQLLWNEHVYMV